MRKNHLYLLSIISLVLLSTLACNLGRAAAPTETPETLTEETPPLAPEGTTAALPAPTGTPAPDISDPGGCTLNASWVADVTVPDNTEFAPSTTFHKVWHVRNSGTCT